MAIEFDAVKLGDTIRVKTWSGPVVTGVVDDKDYEGKNGRSTLGYEIVDTGAGHWCYMDQVVSIVK